MVSTTYSPVDVLIIGGGPAGQAAAVSVARNLHTAIVLDSHKYRNERADHMHMMPTLDGTHPEEFREGARKNTSMNYDFIKFQDADITQAKKNEEDESFVVADDAGRTWVGKALVLATGVEDVMLDIPGFEECWARSIYHCLFCFGYEQRGSPSSGILAVDPTLQVPFILHIARNAAQLSEKVTIYTNGDYTRTDVLKTAIGSKAPIIIDERQIAQFALGPKGVGVTITFEEGTSKYESFLAHNPELRLRSAELASQLGVHVTKQGVITVQPPFGETNVAGCFAAGDAANAVKTIPNAVSSGAVAASGAAGHVQSRLYGQMSVGDVLRAQSKTA